MLLKVFFDLLYHSLSWTYDAVAWVVSFGRWQGWVMSVLPYIQATCVLELGYGPGHLLVKLKEAGCTAIGLDESRQMALMAGDRLRRAFRHKPPAIARGIGQEAPFAGGSFDTVVATFPAPYITQLDTLAEIYRMLRPEGSLLILLAAWITGRGLLDRALALVYRVTGETPSLEDERLQKMFDRFAKAGFQAELVWIDRPSSRLMLIKARKSPYFSEINS